MAFPWIWYVLVLVIKSTVHVIVVPLFGKESLFGCSMIYLNVLLNCQHGLYIYSEMNGWIFRLVNAVHARRDKIKVCQGTLFKLCASCVTSSVCLSDFFSHDTRLCMDQ